MNTERVIYQKFDTTAEILHGNQLKTTTESQLRLTAAEIIPFASASFIFFLFDFSSLFFLACFFRIHRPRFITNKTDEVEVEKENENIRVEFFVFFFL